MVLFAKKYHGSSYFATARFFSFALPKSTACPIAGTSLINSEIHREGFVDYTASFKNFT